MNQIKRLSMCRICLVQDVRMFAVTDKNLQEIYQRLTDIPFVTEDSRPMLACFFCYVKLKQCCQMKTKCLKAEQLLAQILKDDDEQKPLIYQAQFDFCGGLKVTPTKVIISIVDGCQIECNPVKEELPSDASVEGRDCVELKDPLQSDDSDDDVSLKEFKIEEDEDEELIYTIGLVPGNLELSIQSQVALLPRNTESDSEDDLPLTKIQTIVGEEPEVPQERRRAVKNNTKGKVTSRSDRIMALPRKTTASNTSSGHYSKLPAIDSASSSRTSDFSIPKCSKQTDKKEQSIVTDINKIWQRYVNFNDHSKIFDFHNEYQNSRSAVLANDMAHFDSVFFEKEPFDEDFLKCTETLTTSDEKIENSQIDNILSLFEDSDDSVKDKNYITASDTTDTDCEDSLISRAHTFNPQENSIAIETDNLHININGSILEQKSIRVNCDSTVNLNNLAQLNLINNPVQEGKGLTKSGLPRKRRMFVDSLTERKKMKKQLLIKKLSLKTACIENCRRKCSMNINDDQRMLINNYYSKLSKESQGIFIKGMVETKAVGRRIQTSREIPKRKLTYAYFLTKSDDVRIKVCKQFFLTTLGYHPKNDRRVIAALKRPVDQQKDRRGVYERTNKIDRNTIKDHVLGYNPAISHYRREHAPNKLYLPSDINVSIMYKNFCDKFPDFKVSLETYRTVVKNELNISFTHQGNEECELCAIFKLHNPEHNNNPDNTCVVCNKYNTHKVRYTESRIKYKEDVDNAIVDKTTIRYSVDLQKVIMLPRLDQYKASIFCPRIIAFNESFVPLGKTSKEEMPFAVIWNESISGRHQHDIISTIRAFLLHKRDAEHVILWADNCASQNKNWALMSFLVELINSSLISANTIEIRYFEPGHTSMSADHFHHQVEKMLGKNKVYDFDDYVQRVKMANNRKCIVKSLGDSDFYLYEDLSSQYKLSNMEPRIYLKNIMVVKVERGQFVLMYKTGHNEMFQSLDFLQAKIVKTQKFPEVKSKNIPRGITADRKAEIIQKLVPLMPENKREFWSNIPVSNSATNLLTEEF